MRPGTQLIAAGKDCEHLVARIESLWRRIQLSRRRGRCTGSGVSGIGNRRPRHRSASATAAATAVAADEEDLEGNSAECGDAFSPYASSINMLAFCASERRRVKPADHQPAFCPTIDRITSAVSTTGATTAEATAPAAHVGSGLNLPLADLSSSASSLLPTSSGTLPPSASSTCCRHGLLEPAASLGGAGNSRPPTPELRSCQLAENDLRDGQRVLLSEAPVESFGPAPDGSPSSCCLWYLGVVKEVQPPDVYRVSLSGSARSRRQYMTREELLCRAVLEIRPSSRAELPPGSRVCAYWSDSLTALYPGTVRPLPEGVEVAANEVYVEFDDSDRRCVRLDRIDRKSVV